MTTRTETIGTNIFEGNKGISNIWLGLFLVLSALGIYGVGNIIINGHANTLGVTRTVPWGILISSYEFFVVASVGLCLISSMGYAFGIDRYKLIARRSIVLAIATLLCGFGIIGLELGHPFRMLIYSVTSPNLHSPVWWMGTLYGLYLVCMIILLYFLFTKNYKSAQAVGLIGFFTAIAANANMGAVLGLLEARPFWHGPFLPIYFILSALIVGSAMILIIISIAHGGQSRLPEKFTELSKGVSKILGLLLGIMIVFEIIKIIASTYGMPPEKYEAMKVLLNGELSFNFWFFEVMLGMIIPFLIIIFTKGNNIKATLVASISAVIGSFFMRYDLVIAGQLYPMRAATPGAGVQGATANGFVTYVPSFTEIAIVIGAISFCCFLYLAAERFLNLNE